MRVGDRLYAQRAEYEFHRALARRFSRVRIHPKVYQETSRHYELFKEIYTTPIECGKMDVVPMPDYSSFRRWPPPLYRMRCGAEWVKILRHSLTAVNYALIYAPSTLGLAGAIAAARRNMPFILYIGGEWGTFNRRESGSGSFQGWPGWLRRVFWRGQRGWMTRRAYAIVARNPAEVAELQAEGYDVHYIRGNNSIRKSEVFQRSDSCHGEKASILTVGTLTPNKNFVIVLKALREALDRDPGCPLQLVHVGARYRGELERVRRVVTTLELGEKVEFKGFLTGRALLEEFRKADLFIHASHSEGYPRVITEAQSQGLPVIATAVDGILARHKDERDVLLVGTPDAEELGAAIRRVVGEGALRRQLIARGYRTVAREFHRPDPAKVIERLLRAVPIGSTSER